VPREERQTPNAAKGEANLRQVLEQGQPALIFAASRHSAVAGRAWSKPERDLR